MSIKAIIISVLFLSATLASATPEPEAQPYDEMVGVDEYYLDQAQDYYDSFEAYETDTYNDDSVPTEPTLNIPQITAPDDNRSDYSEYQAGEFYQDDTGHYGHNPDVDYDGYGSYQEYTEPGISQTDETIAGITNEFGNTEQPTDVPDEYDASLDGLDPYYDYDGQLQTPSPFDATADEPEALLNDGLIELFEEQNYFS